MSFKYLRNIIFPTLLLASRHGADNYTYRTFYNSFEILLPKDWKETRLKPFMDDIDEELYWSRLLPPDSSAIMFVSILKPISERYDSTSIKYRIIDEIVSTKKRLPPSGLIGTQEREANGKRYGIITLSDSTSRTRTRYIIVFNKWGHLYQAEIVNFKSAMADFSAVTDKIGESLRFLEEVRLSFFQTRPN